MAAPVGVLLPNRSDDTFGNAVGLRLVAALKTSIFRKRYIWYIPVPEAQTRCGEAPQARARRQEAAMHSPRSRSPFSLTAFGALMDPDYLRQATNDPCAANPVERSEPESAASPSENDAGELPLALALSWCDRARAPQAAALLRWCSLCLVELQRTRRKAMRSMRF